MKKLKIKLRQYSKFIISLLIIVSISNKVISNNIKIEINGNNFTDKDVILSLLKDPPSEISDKYSNYLIKTLDNSQLFEQVSVEVNENTYIINIKEYPNINKIYFKNNDRFDDEELSKLTNEFKIFNLNPISINEFISELQNLYKSFGYNNSQITFTSKLYKETNTADLYFEFKEGNITKVAKIYFSGNDTIDKEELKSVIKTKTKTLTNIFANNNYKKYIIENDLVAIKKYYINKGYIDIKVDFSVEYLKSNKVNIYFKIIEGEVYQYKNITLTDKNKMLNPDLQSNIKNLINNTISQNNIYSLTEINKLNADISDLIMKDGIQFFEINVLEKKDLKHVSIVYEIYQIEPKYAKQINIYGNTRTFDKVIRRELKLVEGDAYHKSQLKNIQKKLNSLGLFKSVEIIEKEIDNELSEIQIIVDEKQTGTFNVGLSIGTLEGFGVVAGLSERNFYGTGRSLKTLINTTDDKTEFTFETTDRINYVNDVNVTYKAQLKQEDFSVASSYKLDTLSTGIGISYKVSPLINHAINLDYIIKDYKITNASTVASTINNSSGENVSFVLNNRLSYNTLNSLVLPQNGTFVSYINSIETPTSSSNGTFKNIITYKKYNKIDKNIFSFQARVGNIISLSNNDILTDDKFSLGGRWLRGFDTFGAGPRNSRSSYVGGNNLVVTKFDISRELSKDSQFPFYVNIFNDYGLVWENKTKPTKNDNTIRSSVGFGFKYYSAIGPIGFAWGFPIQDEEYDIKRMFLFSIGNLD